MTAYNLPRSYAHLVVKAQLGLARKVAVGPGIVAIGQALYQIRDAQDREDALSVRLVSIRERKEPDFARIQRLEECAQRGR